MTALSYVGLESPFLRGSGGFDALKRDRVRSLYIKYTNVLGRLLVESSHMPIALNQGYWYQFLDSQVPLEHAMARSATREVLRRSGIQTLYRGVDLGFTLDMLHTDIDARAMGIVVSPIELTTEQPDLWAKEFVAEFGAELIAEVIENNAQYTEVFCGAHHNDA